MTSSLGRRALLVLVALIWAVSWPVIKVGVSTVPPLWFACLRYLMQQRVSVGSLRIGVCAGAEQEFKGL